jgi:hypothetical protein
MKCPRCGKSMIHLGTDRAGRSITASTATKTNFMVPKRMKKKLEIILILILALALGFCITAGHFIFQQTTPCLRFSENGFSEAQIDRR